MLNQAISETQSWIEKFIIKESICPFASVPFAKGQIQYQLSSHLSFPETIQECLSICMKMHLDQSISTAFYIIDNLLYDFEDLIDLNESCTKLLEQYNLDHQFQLVSFHPQFVFDHVPESSTEHYTNRSPYPMLHFLREADVTKAVDHHGDIPSIIVKNKATTQRLFGKKS